MQFVFGIDVSCDSVTVAVASDEHTLLREYKINSDKAGFSRLLKDLRSVNHPQIIYESTGVYSRRVRTFLIHQGYDFVELNPLQAKLDLTENFRRKKTDRNDARDLACSQYIRNRLTTVQEKPVYLDLRDNERFYQQLTRDDAHNIVAVGTSDEAIMRVITQITQDNGGIAVGDEHQVLATMPLAIGGLLSTSTYQVAAAQLDGLKQAYEVISEQPLSFDPFITLSFLTLPVIPTLKLTARGLFDYDSFDFIPVATAATTESLATSR